MKEKSSNVEKGRLVIMEFFSSYKYHTCFSESGYLKTDAQSSYGESVNKKRLEIQCNRRKRRATPPYACLYMYKYTLCRLNRHFCAFMCVICLGDNIENCVGFVMW